MSVRIWPDRTGELGPRPTIIDYLFADGEKMEALLDETQSLVAAGFFDSARTPFVTLARRLDRHIRLEESSVIPSLPPRAATLLGEHAALKRLIADAELRLEERHATPCTRALARLRRSLQMHERHERQLFKHYRAEI